MSTTAVGTAASAVQRAKRAGHSLLKIVVSKDVNMTIMTMIVIWIGRDLTMSAQTWTVAQAKAKFSEVIDRAMSEGPQTVTRKGRTAVVVVDAEEWNRKTKRVGTLADFFAPPRCGDQV